jgi:hypothetical protein
MKLFRLFLVLMLFVFVGSLGAEKRFGRDIIKLQNPQDFQYFKLDDINYPVLHGTNFDVSCLVYRGTRNYYIEVAISNNFKQPVALSGDFIAFSKPGYTVMRTNTSDTAKEFFAAAQVPFIPAPPPKVQGTQTTTYNANATTYGNQTNINGSATTTTDNSQQAGANMGNALGNALAARSYRNAQAMDTKFAHFLYSNAQENQPPQLDPGKVKVIAATFEQLKSKKAPFEILIHVGDETFTFKYQE